MRKNKVVPSRPALQDVQEESDAASQHVFKLELRDGPDWRGCDQRELSIARLVPFLLPSIAQELFFRGKLFGFLLRFSGWVFFPAALLSGAVYSLTLDVGGLIAIEDQDLADHLQRHAPGPFA